ncbi:mannose-1-phosphate guanylyltransferase and mannose-6-phosphate isomerase-related protein [Geotalea daltonii FRC-32]|uniref:Mannose-1-phosphate guanylyltransferase and mannose-6-phosphate isomerase-related protein n=1 Tax=Geotalea daltonii (strain DSM 22248 / JCM 15807 / FRC-32) TaxID=316067 RepID=B9M2I9_GEODF|nr:mannose-1-phosphate guanyltransferase [Geotalea daltonii]ACM19368.1 mannose-1-phosphate guanylyltransferase and mannose-6-phosphate isomerase-related protein [Geotalea daltonii FRC-32]
MKAVIMAGGFGTRMQPLTCNTPKPMVPLLNRPIMLHIVELLKKYHVTDLVLLLYHQPNVIKNFFRDGADFGVKITYVTPLEDMGTAGAVKYAEKYLKERFLIISGDLLTDFNLQKVLNFHEDNKALATITLTSVKDPLQFGVVITDKEKRITQFLEKPGWGEIISDTINTGIYVLEPEIFKYIPEGENFDFSQDLFPLLLKKKEPLFGFPLKGYWRDIGNTDSYREAHHDILRGKVYARIDAHKQDLIGKDLRIGADVKLDRSVILDGTVVIGDNSQVQDNAQLKDTVIGRNCTIEPGVRLSRCVIWDNVYIKRGAKITDSVICNNVSVGQGVVMEEGTIVADDTSIGEEVYIKRDVKIWPRKVIEGGSTVTGNLIWGERWKKSLFEGKMIKGLTNIELTPEFVAKLGCAYGTSLQKGSFVLAGRDASLSSRMLKRSFLGGILSAGVNVRDLKMVSLPIMRYKLRTFGEGGGVHFRQAIDDPASTEIVFLDADGLDFSSSMGKNVERIFYKENFRRAHHMEPGGISELPQVADFYREGFARALDMELLRKAGFKVVVDFNHSPAGQTLPAILNDMGCEVIGINAYIDEERVTKKPENNAQSLQQLAKIVSSLEAKAGFWLDTTSEEVILVDETGRLYEPSEFLTLLVALSLKTGVRGAFAVPVSAPSVIEQLAHEKGCSVRRTKSAERSMIEAAQSSEVIMAGSMDGRFAFPKFQAAFDGMFTIAKTIELAAAAEIPLSRILDDIPRRTFLQGRVPCVWDMKGGIMRKMSEDSLEREAIYIDGIKVHFGEDWVLVLPDQYNPYVHIIAEAKDQKVAHRLLDEYRKKVEKWKKELQ